MQNFKLKTKDKIDIAVNHYERGNEAAVIIAPGWCMTKDSRAFSRIAEMFSEYYGVICFDFRGHGQSGGMYTFTAAEIMDMDCIVRFARKCGYKKIYLAGFSLGAAISLIYASKSRFINKVIAVSAPYDFNKIENQMWKKEAWGETFKKFELKRFLSIRPYPLPMKKIKPADIIEDINQPVLFIAGAKDPTVYSWHTNALYEKAKCKKQYKEYETGCHAEDLFLHFEADFSKLCIDFLNE